MPTPTKPALRVSQIAVNVVLLNEHDAPLPTGDPVVFVGDENGTAIEHAAAWLADLPAHLETAATAPEGPPAD